MPKQPKSSAPSTDIKRPASAPAIPETYPRAIGTGLLTNPNDLGIRQLDWLMSNLNAMPDLDAILSSVGMSRKQLEALESDDEIYAAIETRRDAVISTNWHLEPNGTPQTDFIEQQLRAHGDSIIRGAWRSVLYGYSVVEVVYEVQQGGSIGNAVGIKCVQVCPVDWFSLRGDGALMINTNGVFEPCDTQFKFFLTVRNPTYRQPYGEAVLSRLFWAWRFRSSGWQYWIQFMERHATPLLIGSSNDLDGMQNALSKLARMALALPAEATVQAITAAQSGEFERFNQAVNQRIQRTILGQTMTNGADGGGSLAAFKALNLIREEKKDGDLGLITPTIQAVVNALWQLNGFGDDTTAPKFVFENDVGLQEDRATRDAELVKAGILTLTEDYLIRNYDFEAGDFVLNSVTEQSSATAEKSSGVQKPIVKESLTTQPPTPTGKESLTVRFNAARSSDPFTPEQMQLERLADAAIAAAPPPFDIRDIQAAIKSATSPDDLVHQLSVLMLDQPDAMYQQVMERALFAADILGYAQQDKGSKPV